MIPFLDLPLLAGDFGQACFLSESWFFSSVRRRVGPDCLQGPFAAACLDSSLWGSQPEVALELLVVGWCLCWDWRQRVSSCVSAQCSENICPTLALVFCTLFIIWTLLVSFTVGRTSLTRQCGHLHWHVSFVSSLPACCCRVTSGLGFWTLGCLAAHKFLDWLVESSE